MYYKNLICQTPCTRFEEFEAAILKNESFHRPRRGGAPLAAGYVLMGTCYCLWILLLKGGGTEEASHI